MAHHTLDWLLEPTFPAAPRLPRLNRELYELAEMDEPAPVSGARPAQYPSGTWLLGARGVAEPESESDSEADRFATSSPEAPTVRPGSLHSHKIG